MTWSASRTSPRARSNERGFTLTELMAAVAIMGILATLAIAALHHRAYASDTTNAKVFIKAMVAAEEHYRAENQLYYDVSSPGDAGWFPTGNIQPNSQVGFWNSGHADIAKWRTLAPDIRQNASFGYKVNAGLPTDTPKFDDEMSSITPPAVTEPWYLIQARVDSDGNGVGCMVAAASWTPEVFSINDGE